MSETQTQAPRLIEELLGYALRQGYAVQSGEGTQSPSVIFADGDYEIGDGRCGLHEDQKPANEPAIPYVRIDALINATARITALESENARLLDNAQKDAWLWSAYHEWCTKNDCAPSSGELLRSHKSYAAREQTLRDALSCALEQLAQCLGSDTEAGRKGRAALGDGE